MKNDKEKILKFSFLVVHGPIFLILIFLYFLSRLVNLTIIPVFADEAIYIRWAQVMKAESTLRFLPLSDGKQPLFMWLVIPFLKLIKDPLVAGRIVSVFSGFGTMAGVFVLSYLLFKKINLSFLASILYLISPFTLFFDRMALADSLLSMFGVWCLVLGVSLAMWLRLDLAMITGIILGLALITKSPAWFFALLLPTTLIVFNFKRKNLPLHLIKVVVLWGVVLVFAFAIYNILRLGPEFHMIAIRNKDYVFSFKEILAHPFDPLKPHLFDLASWLPNLLTWPILLLALSGFIWMWLKKENWRQATWLFLVSALPLFIQSVFAKVFTPRYILFTVWPLIIAAAYFLEVIIKKLKIKNSLQALLPFLIVIPSFYYNYLLLTNPEKAPLPRNIRSGHLEEWTAGQGIKEIADFVKEKAKEKNILVGTEGFFGTLPDGLQVYLEKVPRVTVIGVGYPINKVETSLINALVDNDVYLVVNQSRLLISTEDYGLKIMADYPKAVNPEGYQDKLLFFELDKDFWQQK